MEKENDPYRPPRELESEDVRRGCSSAMKSLLIALARAMSYSAGLMSLVGFLLFYLAKRKGGMVWGGMLMTCSGPIAIIAFLLCCVAAGIHTRDELERRPLLLAIFCIAMTFGIYAVGLPIIS